MEVQLDTKLSGQAIMDLLATKGIDFEAVKQPIPNVRNAWRDENNNLVIPASDVDTGLFTVQHATNGTIFNAGVKKGYEILQYKESFAKLQEIAKVRDTNLVSAGTWGKGGEAFVQFDIGEFDVGNGGDKIMKRLTAISSHSSKFAFLIMITPYRLWCQNQITGMQSQAKKEMKRAIKSSMRIKHTKSGNDLIASIGEWLEIVDGQFTSLQNLYNRLNNIRITDQAMIGKVLANLFTVQKDSERSKTMVRNQLTNVVNRFKDADGGKTDKMTAWNLYNSIQGTYQHDPIKETVTHDKSVLVGAVAEKSRLAMEVVVDVCSNQNTDPSKYPVDKDIEILLSEFNF